MPSARGRETHFVLMRGEWLEHPCPADMPTQDFAWQPATASFEPIRMRAQHVEMTIILRTPNGYYAWSTTLPCCDCGLAGYTAPAPHAPPCPWEPQPDAVVLMHGAEGMMPYARSGILMQGGYVWR